MPNWASSFCRSGLSPGHSVLVPGLPAAPKPSQSFKKTYCIFCLHAPSQASPADAHSCASKADWQGSISKTSYAICDSISPQSVITHSAQVALNALNGRCGCNWCRVGGSGLNPATPPWSRAEPVPPRGLPLHRVAPPPPTPEARASSDLRFSPSPSRTPSQDRSKNSYALQQQIPAARREF